MKVAFQGELGAYSHVAVTRVFPDGEPVSCMTFWDALQAVERGEAARAVIPVENSTAGRVAGMHYLLPQTSLYIIGEYSLPVRHCLLGCEGATLERITTVFSHEQALAQCAKNLREHGMYAQSYGDTAGAARYISEQQNPSYGALASSLAADMYGLHVLQKDMQDTSHNTTRFLVFSPETETVDVSAPTKTSFIFQVRSIPAALYKAMGGFATNGVNLTKLESYVEGERFEVARFFAEIEGHIDAPSVQLAFEELRFFSEDVRILGTYPTYPAEE